MINYCVLIKTIIHAHTLWFKVKTNLMNKKKKKEIEDYSLDFFVADLGRVWFQRIEASECAQINQIKQRVGEEGFRLAEKLESESEGGFKRPVPWVQLSLSDCKKQRGDLSSLCPGSLVNANRTRLLPLCPHCPITGELGGNHFKVIDWFHFGIFDIDICMVIWFWGLSFEGCKIRI